MRWSQALSQTAALGKSFDCVEPQFNLKGFAWVQMPPLNKKAVNVSSLNIKDYLLSQMTKVPTWNYFKLSRFGIQEFVACLRLSSLYCFLCHFVCPWGHKVQDSTCPCDKIRQKRPSLFLVSFHECKTLSQKYFRWLLKLELIVLKFGHILEVILISIFVYKPLKIRFICWYNIIKTFQFWIKIKFWIKFWIKIKFFRRHTKENTSFLVLNMYEGWSTENNSLEGIFSSSKK